MFIDKTRILISALSKYLGKPIIRTNQNAEPPDYPFGAYTITTYKNEYKGTYSVHKDGIDRKPYKQTVSLTFQSEKYEEAVELADKAHTWLDYLGDTQLKQKGVVVQSVGAITNRDNLLTAEYEYRLGFDFTLSCMNEVESPIEYTDDILVHKTDL